MNVRLFSNLRFAPLFLGTLFLVQGCINSDHSAPPTAKEQIGDAVADAVSDTEAKQVELALRAVDDMAKIQSLKALSPHLIEMSTSDGVAYVTRQAVHKPAMVRKAKKAILKALEYQRERRGTTLVEIVTNCNSGWKMTPVQSNQWLEEHMLAYYPLGDIKDVNI